MGGAVADELGSLRLWWDGEMTQERFRDGAPYTLEQFWPPGEDWIEIIQRALRKYNLGAYHDLQEGVAEIVRILWHRNIFERFDARRARSFLIYYRGIVDNAINNLRVSRNRSDREADFGVRSSVGGEEDAVTVTERFAIASDEAPGSTFVFLEAVHSDLQAINCRMAQRFSVNLGIQCAEVFRGFEHHGIPNSKAAFLEACARHQLPPISGKLLWPHYRKEFRDLVSKHIVRPRKRKKKKGPELIALEVLGRVNQYFVLSRGLHTARVVKIDLYESYIELAGTGGRKGVLDPSLRIHNRELASGVVTEIVEFSHKFR